MFKILKNIFNLFYVTCHQPDIDKIYLYAKKDRMKQSTSSKGLKQLNDFKSIIEYSNDMDDIYKKIEEYNSSKERKILIVFDDIIADMIIYIKLNSSSN